MPASELQERQAAEEKADPSFPFKFKAPSGRVHRLHVDPTAGIAELVRNVSAKLGAEVDAIGGQAVVDDGKLSNTGFAMSYVDSESDTVSITADQDLVDAISIARKANRDKVDLFVHSPDSTPVIPKEPEPVAAAKAVSPPESVTVAAEEDNAHREEFTTNSKPAAQPLVQPSTDQQLINGIPNELILPGAIVTLAAVIVGVFVLSRAGRR